MVLDREYATFRAKLPQLLAKDAGRYVLIHGDDVIATFNTQEQALIAGWERSLNGPFLVKQVVAYEPPIPLNGRGDSSTTARPFGTVLDREYATYRAKLPELLAKDAGRYVLIHGDDVIGVFDTQLQALEAGYDRWLFEPFLITRIEAETKPVRIG